MQDNPFTDKLEIENALALYDEILEGPMQDRMPSVMSSTQSLRPDIFTAVMAAGKPILFEGSLPVSVKQMVVMIIANRRNSSFCIDIHKKMLESMGIEAALIDSCLDDPEMNLVPPMFRQILQFAVMAASRLTKSAMINSRCCAIAVLTRKKSWKSQWSHRLPISSLPGPMYPST